MRLLIQKIPFQLLFISLFLALAVLAAGVRGASAYSQPSPECLLFESFDLQQSYCYATCNSASSCAILDTKYAKVDASRPSNQKRSYYEFYTDPLPAPSNGNGYEPSDDSLYTTYEIQRGALGVQVDGTSSSTPFTRNYDQHTWTLISPLIPDLIKTKIARFSGYNDDSGETGAMATPIDDSGDFWEISFNDNGLYTDRGTVADRGETIHSIVHELGHVATLGFSLSSDQHCNNFTNEDQCVIKGSYVDQYAKQFWPAVYTKGGDISGTYRSSQFVSSYAATNIAEDMAESWTAFVLLDKPTGKTIADKKILFFYSYPEFVKARAQILAHIGHVH